jgi:hypothetical protein
MNDLERKQKIVSKINDIQTEILILGWNGILKKYHPEYNLDNQDAEKIFKLYKQVYENIKRKISITT